MLQTELQYPTSNNTMESFYYCFTLVISLSLATLSSASNSTEWINCGTPRSFIVEQEKDQRVFIYDSEYQIGIPRDELAVYKYYGTNDVNFLVNRTMVIFTGYLLPEEGDLAIELPKTNIIWEAQVVGSAKLNTSKYKSDEMVTTGHQLYVRRNKQDENSLSAIVQKEIDYRVSDCISNRIAEKIGAITPADLKRGEDNPYYFGSFSALSGSSEIMEKPRFTNEQRKALLSKFDDPSAYKSSAEEIEEMINELIDQALIHLKDLIGQATGGIVQIPEIHNNFKVGSGWWETTGEFDAVDGTFGDLRTIKKTRRAKLESGAGLHKYIASGGFGLSKTHILYKQYKLRFGIIRVSGTVSGRADDISIYGAAGVDYGVKPCKCFLKELKFESIGKLQIDITGLGPLNRLISKLLTFIAESWKGDIATRIENELKSFIVKNIHQIPCEDFRPSGTP